MRLVLDTSIIIELERKNKAIEMQIEDLRKIHPFPPQISFYTYFEFLEGIVKKSDKNKLRSQQFISLFEILQTSSATANHLVLLKQKYALPIPDLFIAAQVMETNAVLVTKDKDFEQIKEIQKIIL
ncbi:type II toxin-antitoxin system VapC family toxin [Candidatus Pacearchaeota archaeon]|nr:type II toxin-antitoxin system VapC family toxin [Candidatus Pacearchaeota archaeon]